MGCVCDHRLLHAFAYVLLSLLLEFLYLLHVFNSVMQSCIHLLVGILALHFYDANATVGMPYPTRECVPAETRICFL